MASLIPNLDRIDPHTKIYASGAILLFLVGILFALGSRPSEKNDDENASAFNSFIKFFYASFLKPHSSRSVTGSQQDALESFYKSQAGVYDKTRARLLRGREDMLGLVAAQLVHKAATERTHDTKRIWVDVSPLFLN